MDSQPHKIMTHVRLTSENLKHDWAIISLYPAEAVTMFTQCSTESCELCCPSITSSWIDSLFEWNTQIRAVKVYGARTYSRGFYCGHL